MAQICTEVVSPRSQVTLADVLTDTDCDEGLDLRQLKAANKAPPWLGVSREAMSEGRGKPLGMTLEASEI